MDPVFAGCGWLSLAYCCCCSGRKLLHREDSDVQITDAGVLLNLSGQAETEVAETAGMGFFIVATCSPQLGGISIF